MVNNSMDFTTMLYLNRERPDWADKIVKLENINLAYRVVHTGWDTSIEALNHCTTMAHHHIYYNHVYKHTNFITHFATVQ